MRGLQEILSNKLNSATGLLPPTASQVNVFLSSMDSSMAMLVRKSLTWFEILVRLRKNQNKQTNAFFLVNYIIQDPLGVQLTSHTDLATLRSKKPHP